MGSLAKTITDHDSSKKDHRANKIVNEIVRDEPDYSSWGRKSIIMLKNMGLLKAKDINKNRYPGSLRAEYIYNDYHERQTNPGYSRNAEGGRFFTS
jgi:hypothetical protein